MGIIALVIVGGAGLFLFMLYATIKTKSTNIDQYEPFKEWVGKTVTLDKETVVFEEKIRMVTTNKYPYTLTDSLHPDWQYIHNMEETGDAVRITSFPAGTKLKLEKAVQYTGGVSGSSEPMLFGTINDGEKAYKVGYQWGKTDLNIDFDKIEKSWLFHRAPWQEEQDTAHYALPRAEWW
ncbi:hypothetical protein DN748_11275 [Sinomicrobium soli]|nr:hypothetical protein DN748_11275 [Sinomicrobium sp. N-1-3-6]